VADTTSRFRHRNKGELKREAAEDRADRPEGKRASHDFSSPRTLPGSPHHQSIKAQTRCKKVEVWVRGGGSGGVRGGGSGGGQQSQHHTWLEPALRKDVGLAVAAASDAAASSYASSFSSSLSRNKRTP
jgi:hypothetical protein